MAEQGTRTVTEGDITVLVKKPLSVRSLPLTIHVSGVQIPSLTSHRHALRLVEKNLPTVKDFKALLPETRIPVVQMDQWKKVATQIL